MKSKYYIPDITEFRIGFEYEIEMGGNWYLRDIPFYPLVDDSGLEYRVKYLDKEDIESFGFTIISDYGAGTTYLLENTYEMDTAKHAGIIYEKDFITISKRRGVFRTTYKDILFAGIIKNKSELKQVLKMIGVIE